MSQLISCPLVTNGLVGITDTAGVFTRQILNPPTTYPQVIESVGAIAIVAPFFNIAALAGKTIEAVSLHGTISERPGIDVVGNLECVDATGVLESSTDADIYNTVDSSANVFVETATPPAGDFVKALVGGPTAAAILQTVVDALGTQWGVGLRMDGGVWILRMASVVGDLSKWSLTVTVAGSTNRLEVGRRRGSCGRFATRRRRILLN